MGALAPVAPVAFPPARYQDDSGTLIRDLRAVNATSVIVYPGALKHIPDLHAAGINKIHLLTGYDGNGVTRDAVRDWWRVRGIILGDEPNLPGRMTPTMYAERFERARVRIRQEGIHTPVYTAALAGVGGFLRKYGGNPDNEYMLAVRQALGQDALVPHNLFHSRLSKGLPGFDAVVGTGFENYAFWREPINWWFRRIIGFAGVIGGTRELYDFVGVWCLGTYRSNRWGMVRPDGSLTSSGKALRRYLRE